MSTLPPVAAAGAASVAAPERLDGPGRLDRGQYRCSYRLRGDAGQVLLQRVHVRVRWFVGACLVATYHGRYHEWFRFARDGAAVLDHHDFMVQRDRWTPRDLQQLLRAQAPERRLPTRGDARLDVHKSFQLGLGTVTDEHAVAVAADVEFGIVATGNGQPILARLTFEALAGHAAATVADVPHAPGGVVVAGRAKFHGPPRWYAHEHFRYHFACLVGSFRDRAGYTDRLFRSPAARCSR